MIKAGPKELASRALREAKSSRGGGESRPARENLAGEREAPETTLVHAPIDRTSSAASSPPRRVPALIGKSAGIAPGPRGTKVGRPRLENAAKTLKATKPWEKLGMSERTWYRRQAEKRSQP